MEPNVEQQPEMIEIQPTKSAVAAIAAGILVIVAGYLAYGYFSRVRTTPTEEFLTEQAFQTEELGGEAESVLEEVPMEEEAGPLAEIPVEQEEADTQVGSPVGGPEVVTSVWVATNYSSGDITGSSWTVNRGDTLWEIAEARYGSGSEWTKILEANKDSIGFLANGSQALIEVGQTLVLVD